MPPRLALRTSAKCDGRRLPTRLVVAPVDRATLLSAWSVDVRVHEPRTDRLLLVLPRGFSRRRLPNRHGLRDTRIVRPRKSRASVGRPALVRLKIGRRVADRSRPRALIRSRKCVLGGRVRPHEIQRSEDADEHSGRHQRDPDDEPGVHPAKLRPPSRSRNDSSIEPMRRVQRRNTRADSPRKSYPTASPLTFFATLAGGCR